MNLYDFENEIELIRSFKINVKWNNYVRDSGELLSESLSNNETAKAIIAMIEKNFPAYSDAFSLATAKDNQKPYIKVDLRKVNGITYKFIPESIKRAYAKGASRELFFKKGIPRDVGNLVGEYVDSKTGKAVGVTNKESHRRGKEEAEKEKLNPNPKKYK